MDADSKINELERRLAEYHDQLTEAITQRDRLALDAAWGVHASLYGLGFALVAILNYDKVIGPLGTLGEVAAGIAFLVCQSAIFAWSNRARMKEVDCLAALPGWVQQWD